LFSKNKRQLPKGTYLNSVEIVNADNNPDLMIKIVPVGYFPEHPNGAHEITKEHIREMVNNLQSQGTDLLFDYGHESIWWAGAPAAGWSPKDSAEARDDGLYIRYPEFTPKASEKVNDREFRYFSPVYRINAKDKSGREIGAELVSVALTNIPYMDKEIDSIKNSNQKENKMDGKELRQKLGLTEDASDEVVNSKIDELAKLNSQPPETPPVKPEPEVEKSESDDKVNSRIEALEIKLKEREEADKEIRVANLINSAISDFKILPAQKEIWENSAKLDYDGTKARLDSIAANAVKPAGVTVPIDTGKPKSRNEKINAAADFIRGFNRQPQFKEIN